MDADHAETLLRPQIEKYPDVRKNNCVYFALAMMQYECWIIAKRWPRVCETFE